MKIHPAQSTAVTPYSDDATSASTSDSSATPATMLPSPVDSLYLSGDPAAMVAALNVMMGTQENQESRKSRDAAGAMQDQADQKELDDMKSAAWNKEMSGIMEGSTTAAGGAMVTVAGLDKFNQAGTEAANGVSGVLNGAGKVAGAGYGFAADQANTQVAADKMVSDSAKRAWDDSNDASKDGRKLVDAAIDFYKEYQQTKAQTDQALAQKV